MISGADDRLAFVITTEAQLDGIIAARSQVTGLGTDSEKSAAKMAAASRTNAQATVQQGATVQQAGQASSEAFKAMYTSGMTWTEFLKSNMAPAMAQFGGHVGAMKELGAQWKAFQSGVASDATGIVGAQKQITDATRAMTLTQMKAIEMNEAMGASSVAATKNMGFFGAVQAEAAGKVGQHSLALGYLERNLANASGKALGLNKSVELAGASLMRFGIGTIQTVGILAGIAAITAAYHLLTDETNKQAAADLAHAHQWSLDHLKTFTASGIGDELKGLQAQRQAAIDARDKGQTFEEWRTRKADPSEQGFLGSTGTDIKDLFNLSSRAERTFAKADELYAAAIVRAKELERAEHLRLVAFSDQVKFQTKANELGLEGLRLTYADGNARHQAVQQIENQKQLEDDRIHQQFRARDEQGHVIALTDDQLAQMVKLLDQNEKMANLKRLILGYEQGLADVAYRQATATMTASGGNVADRYADRLAAIQAEADADTRAGLNAVDVEARKQAQIRQLRRDTARQAMDDARTLTGVMIDSGSKQVKAVGHAAETIRRVVIGAQAAHAAVEAAIEGGKAIGSLAAMDFRGAALHGAAALELAKAAALGAQESLGGGSSGGGGGGSAGSGGGSTFEPRSGTEGQGSLVVNLYSQNPYGDEQIQQVKFLLNRADIMKRGGIAIAPTNGIKAA